MGISVLNVVVVVMSEDGWWVEFYACVGVRVGVRVKVKVCLRVGGVPQWWGIRFGFILMWLVVRVVVFVSVCAEHVYSFLCWFYPVVSYICVWLRRVI